MPLIARLAVPLQIPLMTLLMLALAACALTTLSHRAPAPGTAYAVNADASTAGGTPYGSSAALRSLLF